MVHDARTRRTATREPTEAPILAPRDDDFDISGVDKCVGLEAVDETSMLLEDSSA
jgi:hypothetical protein